MPLSEMTAFDRRILFECLTAAAKGPFFDDNDVHILFGFWRTQLLDIVARIPDIDDDEREVRCAIGGSLNNLLRFPHYQDAQWNAWISASVAEVEEVEKRWCALQPPIEYSAMEVHGPVKIDDRFYRVIAYTVRDGGTGFSTEVWCNGKWLDPISGPGGNEIMAANPATEEELQEAGVDTSPLSLQYNPFGVEMESAE